MRWILCRVMRVGLQKGQRAKVEILGNTKVLILCEEGINKSK
jgi:hypothetical protein